MNTTADSGDRVSVPRQNLTGRALRVNNSCESFISLGCPVQSSVGTSVRDENHELRASMAEKNLHSDPYWSHFVRSLCDGHSRFGTNPFGDLPAFPAESCRCYSMRTNLQREHHRRAKVFLEVFLEVLALRVRDHNSDSDGFQRSHRDRGESPSKSLLDFPVSEEQFAKFCSECNWKGESIFCSRFVEQILKLRIRCYRKTSKT